VAFSIIGAGFGRTGTTSIKLALEHLGFGPCHHMSDVFKDEKQLPFWRDAVNGAEVDWTDALSPFGSGLDWPTTHFWREIATAFPDAKVLLTVRPEDRWVASFQATIRKLIDGRASVPKPHWRDVLEMAHEMIAVQTFDGDMSSESTLRARYRQRISEVTAEIAPERLLVYDVAAGWEPLCKFLNVPVPVATFPHTNTPDDFWQFHGADE